MRCLAGDLKLNLQSNALQLSYTHLDDDKSFVVRVINNAHALTTMKRFCS